MSNNNTPGRGSAARVNWIDNTRGFLLLNTTLFWLLPPSLHSGLHFFSSHPKEGAKAHFINYHDLGAVCYIVIMGMMMSHSFQKRVRLDGKISCIQHMVKRYITIGLIGLAIIFLQNGASLDFLNHTYIYEAGLPIIEWNILLTLSTVGLVAIPLQLTSYKVKLHTAALAAVFYQLMLINGNWRNNVSQVADGGYLAAIFSYGALMITASALGERLSKDKLGIEKTIYILLIAATASLILALLLSTLPELYPNRRQATLTYLLWGFSITTFGLSFFAWLDKKLNKPIPILSGFGKNSIAIFSILLITESLEANNVYEKGDAIYTLMLISIFLLISLLEKKKIIIKV